MAKDRLFNPEKVEMLQKNVGDFIDVDTELEHKLAGEFDGILDEAFAVFRVELERLKKGSLNYNHKQVQKIVEEALAKFDEVWQKKSLRVLRAELFVAIRRGILQGKDMIAVVESDKKQLNRYMKKEDVQNE